MSIRSMLIPFALIAILVGCGKPSTPTNTKTSGTSSASGASQLASAADDPKADVGAPLYPSAAPPLTPPPLPPGNDPIAIQATVQMEDKQTLSAEIDGKIEVVATPMTLRNGRFEFKSKDGAGAEKVVVYDPANIHPAIVFHPRDEKKEYPMWKLVDGDRVSEGQILCVLDNQLWVAKRVAALEIKKASEDALKSAKEGVKLAREKVDLDQKVGTAGSKSALLDDQITYQRFIENECQSYQSIAKAQGDLEEAEVNLKKHNITSRVDGIIRSIIKRPGEFVHSGEKIMEIQSTEKVRLEGNLDAQYYDRVKRDMVVSIEPAVPSAPVKSHAWHRAEVASIAVTGHAKRPLVVSASLDGSALIWDPNLANEQGGLLATHSLPHPVGVRAVACTPPGSKTNLVITGAEDGKVRIWDVSDPTKLPKTPRSEPADTHGSGIHAIAISPNGKYAATAAGREVFIWDIDTGNKLYALPAEHRDTVTTVSFTPQTQLVTAAKDGTVKVWRVGATKAAVAKTIEHRSMAVDTLGVSPDGARVLFDQDKSRIDLVTLTDAQTTGQVSNVGPGISFSTLAIFGPERSEPGAPADKLLPYIIATAGGEGDLKGGLQVWQVSRSGGRGNEIARLMTPGRVPVVCAAFNPNKDQPFLVVGTDRGTVHIWTPSTAVRKKLEGRITNIESSDPRFVSVRVEMPNKELNLLDRSAATIIVDPTR
jgi:WD40 repeat protein